MDLHEAQAKRLRDITAWAHRLRQTLGPLQRANGHRVHFRPCSTGVAMVGLDHDRPQRGKSGFTNLERVAADFEPLFDRHCYKIDHGRPTGEKALQSFLIREAYKHDRLLSPINSAAAETQAPVELWFVTDEIALPIEGGKTVCDILALRRDNGRSTPVLLELKDARMLNRLVAQVEGYAKLMVEHAQLFADLYSALLGTSVAFDGPTEKWMVWPAEGTGRDPREEELLARGIRLVGYSGAGPDRYQFKVGAAPLGMH